MSSEDSTYPKTLCAISIHTHAVFLEVCLGNRSDNNASGPGGLKQEHGLNSQKIGGTLIGEDGLERNIGMVSNTWFLFF
jgi:hypothetical protein